MKREFNLPEFGQLFRSARKKANLTQQELQEKLGIDQTVISRIENGQKTVDAALWFEFCRLAQISPNSLETGFIDNMEPVELKSKFQYNSKYRLSPKYLHFRGTGVRYVMPLIMKLKKYVSEDEAQEFFKKTKIDEDIFINYGCSLNIYFFNEIYELLKKKSLLKREDNVLKLNSNELIKEHGSLHHTHSQPKGNNLGSAFSYMKSHLKRYQENIAILTENESSDTLDFSMKIDESLKFFRCMKDEDFQAFLIDYMEEYIEKYFINYGPFPIELNKISTAKKIGDKCFYQIKAKAS